LTESILLSLVGGGIGLVLARWGIELILYVSPDAIPRSREIGLDWTVLAFTIGISLLTGILFGLIPAIQVVEVATTLVLLIGAGLMIRSFYLLQRVNPGFSHEHLTTVSISLPEKKYPTEEATISFYHRLLENVRALPGVESVAAASGLPLGNNGWQMGFVIDGQPPPPAEQTPLVEVCLVTPDYFRAMNIPVLRGRGFNDRDDRSHLAGR